jgi:hypothetical protein
MTIISFTRGLGFAGTQDGSWQPGERFIQRGTPLYGAALFLS